MLSLMCGRQEDYVDAVKATAFSNGINWNSVVKRCATAYNGYSYTITGLIILPVHWSRKRAGDSESFDEVTKVCLDITGV